MPTRTSSTVHCARQHSFHMVRNRPALQFHVASAIDDDWEWCLQRYCHRNQRLCTIGEMWRVFIRFGGKFLIHSYGDLFHRSIYHTRDWVSRFTWLHHSNNINRPQAYSSIIQSYCALEHYLTYNGEITNSVRACEGFRSFAINRSFIRTFAFACFPWDSISPIQTLDPTFDRRDIISCNLT